MPNDNNTVANALKEVTNILRAEDDEGLPQEQIETSPDRLLDLAIFYKTLDALANAGRSAFDGEAKRLARAHTAEFIANIEKLSEVFDRPGLKTAARPWTRSGSRLRQPRATEAASRARGKFVTNFLGDARSKTDVLKEVFGQGTLLLNAKKLGAVADADNGPGELEAIAGIRLTGPKTRTRRFVEKALKAAGIEISDFDAAVGEAADAAALGDEIRQIDIEITNTEDNEKREALKRKRVSLVQQVEALATDSDNPQAVVSNAASAAVTTSVMETEIGKKLFRQDTQQEQAMLVGTRNPKAKGKAIIAAGAGSGKTRVLAARVVYTTLPEPEGLGAAPHQIIATSFTRASAAELGERINDYSGKMGGQPIVKKNSRGFGTTHAVAARIMRSLSDLGVTTAEAPTIGTRKEDDISPYKLIKMAIAQVKMGASQPPPSQADPNESFFSDVALAEIDQGAAKLKEREHEGKQVFTDKREVLKALAEWIVSDEAKRLRDDPPRGSGWYWTVGYKKKRPDYDVIKVTKDIIKKTYNGWAPTEMQIRRLDEAIDMAGFVYEPAEPVSGSVSTPWSRPREGVDTLSASTLSGAKKKFYESPFETGAANQWFNLDVRGELARAQRVHPSEIPLKKVPLVRDPDGEDITVGDVSRALDIWKGNLITPGQAWSNADHAALAGQRPNSHLAACYAAYEWLKKNDLEHVGAYDGNDLFINFAKEMIRQPAALARVNQSFKHIMVDEAQDLNAAQHLMFGFIAGAIDPATQEPWPDGRMTAKTYTLIGDDKQAIYEFRGANPKVFMSKSELTPGGEQFETAVIESNYRSGRRIVQAANRLIDHNKPEQIPMVCEARNMEKGEGSIRQVQTDDYEGTVDLAVGQIKSLVDADDAEVTPGSFGIATRTNAEVLQWTTQLLANNIPFRCKDQFNPLKNRNAKALINWLKLANADESDHKTINDLIAKGDGQPLTGNPRSGVNAKTLADRLDNLSVQPQYKGKNYLQMLEAGAWKEIYKGRAAARNDENVKPFMDNLRLIKAMTGTPSELLEAVLDLKGANGASMNDTFIERVREDDEAMRAIYEALEEGATQEQIEQEIKNVALAPIQPIVSLLDKHGTIKSAADYIGKLELANDKLHAKDDEVKKTAVVCDTVHGWKGLEVDHLYVPMPGTTFPNPRAPINSERRLAYVAITRGAESVTMLTPATDHYGREAGPSQFVNEACVPTDAESSENPEEMTPPQSDPTAPIEGALQSLSEARLPAVRYPLGSEGWDASQHLSAASEGKEFADTVVRLISARDVADFLGRRSLGLDGLRIPRRVDEGDD